MQVAHSNAQFLIVVGQVLGHPLGQAGHEHALVNGDARADFLEQVIDLRPGLADVDFGVGQAGRPNHLLDDDARRFRQLVGPGRRRHEHHLSDVRFPFLEI